MDKKLMLQEYKEHVEERKELGLPALPLNEEQTASLIELIKKPLKGEDEYFLDLISNKVPAGVEGCLH